MISPVVRTPVCLLTAFSDLQLCCFGGARADWEKSCVLVDEQESPATEGFGPSVRQLGRQQSRLTSLHQRPGIWNMLDIFQELFWGRIS